MKRYPIALTVPQIALVLRALKTVKPEDDDAARHLADELHDVKAMTMAGMTEPEIVSILEENA